MSSLNKEKNNDSVIIEDDIEISTDVDVDDDLDEDVVDEVEDDVEDDVDDDVDDDDADTDIDTELDTELDTDLDTDLDTELDNVDEKKYDTYIRVKDEDRVTDNHLNINEFTGCISIRAKQLSNGAVPYIDVDRLGLIHSIDIAIQELKEGKCPLKLNRRYGSNKIEFWDVNDMIIPTYYYSSV